MSMQRSCTAGHGFASLAVHLRHLLLPACLLPAWSGAAGRRGRGERRAAAPTPLDMASRVAAREHLRNDITRLWRGLLDAQQGNVGVSVCQAMSALPGAGGISGF